MPNDLKKSCLPNQRKLSATWKFQIFKCFENKIQHSKMGYAPILIIDPIPKLAFLK